MFESYVPITFLKNTFKLRRATHSAEEQRLANQDLLQLSRPRTMATVTDDPLDKKVEMTNWEQVRSKYYITDRSQD